ncbi:MAG: hypothetical protein FH759_07035 [Sediminimonas qiaohouensis]|uniref:Ferrochelatase n=1 Tax=Sediminimonas qiaohouensis TaxID=552061 RepID=A0A7C9HIS6_9RHOB|nr:hypothetical protein [Sediminimonas qiaohouensis]MTJ04432.1 hypothetical protein [Sediminimonas qiaohouensis]
MKKFLLAAYLSAASLAPAAQAGEQATMTPDIITQDANAASAPDSGIVIGVLLISIIAILARSSGGGMYMLER